MWFSNSTLLSIRSIEDFYLKNNSIRRYIITEMQLKILIDRSTTNIIDNLHFIE